MSVTSKQKVLIRMDSERTSVKAQVLSAIEKALSKTKVIPVRVVLPGPELDLLHPDDYAYICDLYTKQGWVVTRQHTACLVFS